MKCPFVFVVCSILFHKSDSIPEAADRDDITTRTEAIDIPNAKTSL